MAEIHPCTEEDWIAEAEGKVFSTEEFIEHLRRGPGGDQAGHGFTSRTGGVPVARDQPTS
ncbi:MAG: hypothetical protein ABSG43_24770 [Solirubrobacteraceae bacterium]